MHLCLLLKGIFGALLIRSCCPRYHELVGFDRVHRAARLSFCQAGIGNTSLVEAKENTAVQLFSMRVMLEFLGVWGWAEWGK